MHMASVYGAPWFFGRIEHPRLRSQARDAMELLLSPLESIMCGNSIKAANGASEALLAIADKVRCHVYESRRATHAIFYARPLRLSSPWMLNRLALNLSCLI